MKKRTREARVACDGTTKRLRFDADTTRDSFDAVKRGGHLETSFPHRGNASWTLVHSDEWTTTRHGGGKNADEKEKDVACSGLPPKSPRKPRERDVTIAMLDEAQYWMAVDRFSHLA